MISFLKKLIAKREVSVRTAETRLEKYLEKLGYKLIIEPSGINSILHHYINTTKDYEEITPRVEYLRDCIEVLIHYEKKFSFCQESYICVALNDRYYNFFKKYYAYVPSVTFAFMQKQKYHFLFFQKPLKRDLKDISKFLKENNFDYKTSKIECTHYKNTYQLYFKDSTLCQLSWTNDIPIVEAPDFNLEEFKALCTAYLMLQKQGI